MNYGKAFTYIFITLVVFYGVACSFKGVKEGKLAQQKNIQSDFSYIQPETLLEWIKAKEDVVIVDVRTEEEFAEGHIPRAININFFDPYFKEKIEKLEKNKRYVIYCRSGARALKAINMFKEKGFKNLYLLEGSFNIWLQKNFPVEK